VFVLFLVIIKIWTMDKVRNPSNSVDYNYNYKYNYKNSAIASHHGVGRLNRHLEIFHTVSRYIAKLTI
jgi:hypothetical protein